MTKAQPIEESNNYSQAAAMLGRKGGKARMITMTANERGEIARKAARARWKAKASKSRSA